MSTTDPKPTRKQKHKENKFQTAQNGVERLKTIVRHLPPNLPEEIFWQSVQAWVTDDTVTWKSYHPGKLRTKRLNKEGIPSRAYIAFKHEAQLVTFSREYDGHVFRDKAGNESHAVVEYAPFQKVPTEKKKIDARSHTIDKDEDYLSFLEMLHAGAKTESMSLEALVAASQPPPPPKTTPLLEALKAEKSAQKDKETILRNHAHYKDPAVSGSVGKKEEGKKIKVGVAAAPNANASAQAGKTESPAPTSKKAKKAAAAAHKAALQEQGSTLGKGVPVGGTAAAAPSSAKPPASMSASSGGHGPRQRPPKEPRGRSHSDKGEPAPAPASVSAGPGPGQATPAVMAETAPSGPPPATRPAASAQSPSGQRKNRPVIGLGRHFEAALNGAGVAVATGSGSGSGPGPGPTERKRHDKGGDSGTATTTEGGGGPGGKAGKHARAHARREVRAHPPEVVPSILQRPPETSLDTQRPQSPRGSAGPGEGGPGNPSAGGGGGGRGTPKREKGPGRGRSGYRGG